MNFKKYVCEFIGTAVLVLFGCGTAVVSGGNLVATAVAFGLSIIAMAYVIGNISGCHVNPAVSLAMLVSGKMSVKDFIGYVIAQVLGAFAGAGILYFILSTTGIEIEALGTILFSSSVRIILNSSQFIFLQLSTKQLRFQLFFCQTIQILQFKA